MNIYGIYGQCFSLSACGARQMTEEWRELNINCHLEAFDAFYTPFWAAYGFTKKFVSFSHMATFTATGQHTVSLHLVLICPYLTSATMDSVSTLYLTWRMVLSLFFNINIFCTVILQHGRFKVWIVEIDINIFFLEAKS